MCSEYHVKTNIEELLEPLNASVDSNATAWDKRIKFTTQAPVLRWTQDKLKLEELVFPANPFPNARLSQIQSNKVSKVEKSGVDEEQIVRIYEVPIWKDGFAKHPCLVPMTSFFEPAYWGDSAGKIVEFRDRKRKVQFVPGFILKPRVPSTGKYNGFALLTHTASDQMLDYHHRQIVHLEPEAGLEYLQREFKSAEDRFNFVIDNRVHPDFETNIERPMAKGWDKRVDQHLVSLDEEKAYLKTLLKEKVKA